MPKYHDMTGAERFAELDKMATDYFETTRWRTKFCERYGFTPQTLTSWAASGAPLWAVVAMRDGLVAKAAQEVVQRLHDASH